jgi:hypothetical protein
VVAVGRSSPYWNAPAAFGTDSNRVAASIGLAYLSSKKLPIANPTRLSHRLISVEAPGASGGFWFSDKTRSVHHLACHGH